VALNVADIDAGFAQVRAERTLQRRMADVRNPDFWRALNPDLTISDFPLAARHSRLPVEDAAVARCRAQIVEDGYLQTPRLVPEDECDRLAAGIERIVAEGLPSVLAAVYDEYYNVFGAMEAVFAPLLGPDYVMVTQGVWAFYVAAGDDGRALWTANSPHRDRMAPDARTIAGDVPSIITVWMPLTDVTTEHSCVYVVPKYADPDFNAPPKDVRQNFRLQDIRALPTGAGTVLGWSSHLIHWGSRSSRWAPTPRVAVTMYFQRRDVPLWHPFHIDPSAPCTFRERLTWIDHSMGRPGLLGEVVVERV
jgi:hypothetical protein